MEPSITPSQVRMSAEYIAILEMSERVARRAGVEAVQFMLAETNYGLPVKFRIVMISDVHRIAGAGINCEASELHLSLVDRLIRRPMGTD